MNLNTEIIRKTDSFCIDSTREKKNLKNIINKSQNCINIKNNFISHIENYNLDCWTRGCLICQLLID